MRIGDPASERSCFGLLDLIRVPAPAAGIMATAFIAG
jgi:hypothetical protein